MFLPCRGLVDISGAKLLSLEFGELRLAEQPVGEHRREAEIVKGRKKALIVRQIDKLLIGR